jgi:hypothetical protein
MKIIKYCIAFSIVLFLGNVLAQDNEIYAEEITLEQLL